MPWKFNKAAFKANNCCWVAGRMLIKSMTISFKGNLLSHLPRLPVFINTEGSLRLKLVPWLVEIPVVQQEDGKDNHWAAIFPKLGLPRANHYRLSNKSHATTKQAFGALGCDLRICILATDPICILPNSEQSFAKILENILYFVFWNRRNCEF